MGRQALGRHALGRQALRAAASCAIQGEYSTTFSSIATKSSKLAALRSDKAICDILVKARIITNDSNRYVRRITFQWVDDGVPCEVFIKPMELEA